jgi:hypothetical protein
MSAAQWPALVTLIPLAEPIVRMACFNLALERITIGSACDITSVGTQSRVARAAFPRRCAYEYRRGVPLDPQARHQRRYHHVSEKHMKRYLAEFDFRYN